TCTPRTCASAGATCGTISDGCGGTITCGTCSPGQVCDSASKTCKAAPTSSCQTCSSIAASCGNWSNACGGTISCGACSPGQVCDSTAKTCKSCAPTCDQLPCGTCVTDSCGRAICSCMTGCAIK